MTGKVNIRKLEADLWESADLLRAGSKLTSSQCCMPELALLFLRYAYSRYRMVETELLRNRSSRGGRVIYCKWGYGGTCLPKLMSGEIEV